MISANPPTLLEVLLEPPALLSLSAPELAAFFKFPPALIAAIMPPMPPLVAGAAAASLGPAPPPLLPPLGWPANSVFSTVLTFFRLVPSWIWAKRPPRPAPPVGIAEALLFFCLGADLPDADEEDDDDDPPAGRVHVVTFVCGL